MGGNLLVPASIGILCGFLIIFDPYLSGIFNLSHARPFHLLPILPYTVGIILFFFLLSISWIVVSSGWLWQRKEVLFIWLLFISTQTRSITSFGRVDLSDVVIILFFVVWLLTHFFDESKKVKLSPMTYLLLAFMLFSFISIVNKGQIGGIITLIKISLAVFFLVDIIRAEWMLYQAMKSFLVVSTVSAAIGIAQEFLYLTTGVLYIGNVDTATLSLMFQEGILRVPAFFGIPQALANILVIAWAMIYFLLLTNPGRPFKNRKILLAMLIIVTAALILTFSRGAWLAVLIVFLIGIYLKVPARSIHITVLFITVVLASHYSGLLQIAWDTIYHKMGQGDVSDRIILMRESLQGMRQQHPWIGIGIYSGHIYTATPYHWPVHNTFLRAMVETGIIGGTIFLGVFVYLFLRIGILLSGIVNKERKIIYKTLLLALIALSIDLLFDPFLLSEFWLFLALVQATIMVYKEGLHDSLRN